MVKQFLTIKEKSSCLKNTRGNNCSLSANFKIPEPFANQFFSLDDITNISKSSSEYVTNKLEEMDYGFFVPSSLNKNNNF